MSIKPSPPADQASTNTASQAAWERYWKTGALHSCATSFEGNYGGTLGEFWKRVFAPLAPGDRVIDIATGNGAIPRLLLDTCPYSDVVCAAIDSAPIRPTWLAELPAARAQRVQFHSGVRAEELPFEDRHFALATSQFGIEYSALDSSIPELLRVVRRPGRLAFIVHHAQGRPAQLAREETVHIGWLLQPDGLLDCAQDLVRPMAMAHTAAGRLALASDTAAIALRERFNVLQRELSARISGSPCPDVLYEVRSAIAAALDTASRQDQRGALQAIEAQVQGLQDNRIRLQDLCRCALDARQMNDFVLRFAPAAQTAVAPVEEAGHLMGWSVIISLAGNQAQPN